MSGSIPREVPLIWPERGSGETSVTGLLEGPGEAEAIERPGTWILVREDDGNRIRIPSQGEDLALHAGLRFRVTSEDGRFRWMCVWWTVDEAARSEDTVAALAEASAALDAAHLVAATLIAERSEALAEVDRAHAEVDELKELLRATKLALVLAASERDDFFHLMREATATADRNDQRAATRARALRAAESTATEQFASIAARCARELERHLTRERARSTFALVAYRTMIRDFIASTRLHLEGNPELTMLSARAGVLLEGIPAESWHRAGSAVPPGPIEARPLAPIAHPVLVQIWTFLTQPDLVTEDTRVSAALLAAARAESGLRLSEEDETALGWLRQVAAERSRSGDGWTPANTVWIRADVWLRAAHERGEARR